MNLNYLHLYLRDRRRPKYCHLDFHRHEWMEPVMGFHCDHFGRLYFLDRDLILIDSIPDCDRSMNLIIHNKQLIITHQCFLCYFWVEHLKKLTIV